MQYLIEVHPHHTVVVYTEKMPLGARKLCTVAGYTFWYKAIPSLQKGIVPRASAALTIALQDINVPLTTPVHWHVGGGKKNPESNATREAEKYTKPLL